MQKAQADLAHAARVTTLGELAASLAHEINQPLTAIATSGDACLRWLGRDPPDLDAARQAVSRIVRNAHHAGDVIRSLRALAVKSGPKFTKLDLNGAIQEVLALTRSDLHGHGVALNTDLFADLRPVVGDKVQIQQVLLNLITNAIDAMAEVTDRPKMLKITAHPDQAEQRAHRCRGYWQGIRSGDGRSDFRAVLHDEVQRHGHGALDLQNDRRSPWRPIMGEPQPPHGVIFEFRLPADGRAPDK